MKLNFAIICHLEPFDGAQGTFGVEIHRIDLAGVLIAVAGNADAIGKTFEVFNDDSLPPGAWVGTLRCITPDA